MNLFGRMNFSSNPILGESNVPVSASDAMFDFLQWWDIVIDTETQFKFLLNQEFKDFNVKIIITNYKYLSTYVVLSRRIKFQWHRTLLAQTGIRNYAVPADGAAQMAVILSL